MSWQQITIDNVRLSAQEKAAMQAIQGSGDVGTEVLATVVGEFRGCCQAGGFPVGEEGTVADSARVHVINRARWLWLCEFPKLAALQTKDRKDLNDAAEAYFQRVAQREQNVEPPDGAVASTGNWNSENKILMRTHPVPRPGLPGQTNAENNYANPEGPTDESQSS
jgi:hypothetical protein